MDIQGDHVYRIGMDFDEEDDITVILKDSHDDWWVKGGQPPSDIHALLRAWRRFQTLVSHSSLFGIFYFIQRVIQSKPALFDLGTATDKEIDRQYESVSLTMGTLHATYIRYTSQMVELEKEIRELEIGLAESEAQELEIFKARLR